MSCLNELKRERKKGIRIEEKEEEEEGGRRSREEGVRLGGGKKRGEGIVLGTLFFKEIMLTTAPCHSPFC